MSAPGNHPAWKKKIVSGNRTHLARTLSADDADLVSVVDELPFWSAPFGLELLNSVRLMSHIRALDVGCGLGFPLLELAFRLGRTCMVFGLDPWERALERVKFKMKVLDIRNVEVLRGVAEEMPFGDDYFDLIVSNNGINNVNNMGQSLSECSRVSRAGAQFVLTMNLDGTMVEFYEVFEKILMDNRLLNEIDNMKAHIHAKRRPLNEIRASLEASRFTIVDIKQNNFTIDVVDGTTLFNHYMIRYWFLGEWKKIVEPADQKKIFDQLETRLNEIAAVRGCLQLTVPFITINCTNTKRH